MRIVIIALVVGLLAVAGCQPTPVRPPLATVELPTEARGSMGRIEVVVAQPQSQITISSLPNPGLTFASGVTAGINTGWLKERAELINKALPTFDFPDELLRVAQQSIAGLNKPNLQVRPVVARSAADSLAAFNASTADAVMFFSVTYILTEQGALRFDSWLRLIPGPRRFAGSGRGPTRPVRSMSAVPSSASMSTRNDFFSARTCRRR